jgi:hypothetical protein
MHVGMEGVRKAFSPSHPACATPRSSAAMGVEPAASCCDGTGSARPRRSRSPAVCTGTSASGSSARASFVLGFFSDGAESDAWSLRR